MADLTKSLQSTRRSFLVGAASAFGFAASAPKMIASIAPSQAEVTTAYAWLADHMMEGQWDGKSYMPTHILKTMQTISQHLNASGLPNPVEGKLPALKVLSELHPDRWTVGMPLPPTYETGSPESILMQEVAHMLDPVSALLKQPTPMEKIMLDRQAVYMQRRAAMARPQASSAVTEETVIEEESAERAVFSTTTRRSALQSAFGNFVQNAIEDTPTERASLPAQPMAIPASITTDKDQPAFLRLEAPAP